MGSRLKWWMIMLVTAMLVTAMLGQGLGTWLESPQPDPQIRARIADAPSAVRSEDGQIMALRVFRQGTPRCLFLAASTGRPCAPEVSLSQSGPGWFDSFSGDGRYFGARTSSELSVFEVARGARVSSFPVARYTFFALSHDGTRLAVQYFGEDARLGVFDVPKGRTLWTRVFPHEELWGTAFDRAGQQLAVRDDQGLVVFRVQDGKVLKRVSADRRLEYVTGIPGGRGFLLKRADDTKGSCEVQMFDFRLRPVGPVLAHPKFVNEEACTGDRLATWCFDQQIRVWDLPSGKLRWCQRGYHPRLSADGNFVAFHPTVVDGTTVNPVAIAEAASGRQVASLVPPPGEVLLSVESSRLVWTWHSNGVATLWELPH